MYRSDRLARLQRACAPVLEALEARQLLSAFTVTSLADSGAGTLREGITLADRSTGAQTITFANGLSGDIHLASPLPALMGNITLTGPGANLLTIDANQTGRVLEIAVGAQANVSGLTLTDGLIAGLSGTTPLAYGGGVMNLGTLTMTGTVISECQALGITRTNGEKVGGVGGGIYNPAGATLTLVSSTISGNSVTTGEELGGGVYSGGVLSIVNSTITGNTAAYGGGIVSNKTLSVTDSTISGNFAYYNGSGIDAGGTVVLNGTIVAGAEGYDLIGGATFTGSHDLITDGTDSSGLTSPIVGTTLAPINVKLGALAECGGPTPTMPLLPGSPAIGAGAVFAAANGVDQRGEPRQSGFVDMGAFQTAEVPQPALTVTNLNDSGTGSLRQAITTADAANGNQTINFAPGLSGTILLATPLPALTAQTAIVGPGANVLSINGNGVGSVFTISPGAMGTVEHLTITGGAAAYGGGFDNQGALTISNSTVANNSSVVNGGGIYSTGSVLTISATTVSNNTSGEGAGVFADGSTLTVVASTISGNTASFEAGGIYVDGSYAYISASTLVNSTVTSNSGGAEGGGLFIAGINVAFHVVDSTISGNSGGAGGGIFGNAELYGTIVAQNGGGDLSGRVYGSYDLIGDGSHSGSFTDTLTGTVAQPLNPLLGLLANNGGPTETEALLAGSPAIGKGASEAFADGVDQRGQPRPGPNGFDIGAFQTQLVVNTLADPSTVTAGTLSLRQALADAVTLGGNRTITFLPGLTGTIRLASALPSITTNVVIDGPGVNVVTVNAQSHGAVFTIGSHNVEIENLTITGGNAVNGGGVDNSGGALTLMDDDITGNAGGSGGGLFGAGITIIDSTISGNSAPEGEGGGIYSNGDLTIIGSTFSGNTAAFGGGITSEFLPDTIINSTFANNTATDDGGAIFANGPLSITDSTISGNSAPKGTGGGIFGGGVLYGSIVAQNTGGDLDGTFTGSNDLIGDGSNSSGLTSSLTGTTASLLNPNLGSLANNGGPTDTEALLTGSVAIGEGAVFAAADGVDQRGIARIPGAIDIGAYQTANEPLSLVVNTLGDPSSVTAGTLSLRQAISDADGNPGGATISFASGLSGTIALTSELPSVTGALNVTGPGVSTINVSWPGGGTLLAINAAVAAQISNLSFSNETIADNGALNITGSVVMGRLAGTGTLNIAAASKLAILGSAGGSTLSGVTIATGGTFDLGNNKLVINFDSPAGDPAAGITADLTSGYNAGNWNGTGLASSAAAASPAKFALGYLDGNRAADAGGGTVQPNQFIIAFTVAGDAFLQNSVGFGDLVAVAENFGATGKDWAAGNFNYDPAGSVGFADLVAVAENFGASSGVSEQVSNPPPSPRKTAPTANQPTAMPVDSVTNDSIVGDGDGILQSPSDSLASNDGEIA